MLRIGMYLQDRYEILERIGSGGMSDVYKARCHKLNRLVAIKVLKDEFSSDSTFVGKFKLEAQAAARLSHPNIVSVYDVADEGSMHYIVMELIEGITLKSYIAKKGRLEVREAVGIAIQVAQGIAAAHAQNIVHRDIKPQNIIISRDGKVKVADFGIARAATTQTMTSSAMGSVHYISPEQARGGYSDGRSDIYSLGITIFEMVTGRLPFDGDNTVSIALAHLEEPITRPSVYNPAVPVSLEHIILKCTEKKPEQRYATAEELIADLRRVLLHPDQNFVTMAPQTEPEGETRQISSAEMEQIRKSQKSYHPQGDVRVYEPGRSLSRPPVSGAPARRPVRQEEDDVSPRIERLLTGAGVFVAIVIVAVLIFLVSRFTGFFGLGSGETSGSVQTEVVTAAEEETLSSTQTRMPNVQNLSAEEAEAQLKAENLRVHYEYQTSDQVAENHIISQDPAPDTVVDRGSTVTIVISQGSDLVDLSRLSLTGRQAETVQEELLQQELRSVIMEEASTTVPKGYVIRYTPDTGLHKGDTVTLYVSAGDLRTVPDLRGLTEEAALGSLAQSGFVEGTVTEEHSADVPVGSIIRQGKDPGSQAEAGSAVDYVISLGPEAAQKRYVGAIQETYSLESLIGPGALESSVRVMVRLKQEVNGAPVYTTLIEETTLNGSELLPIQFSNLEGAPGVEYGEVEVVNTENGDVLQSYPVKFFEVG